MSAADEKADNIIKGMACGTTVIATMPPVVDVAVYAAAVAGSVMAIGSCYGVDISKGDAKKLVIEFLSFGGFTFAAGKFIAGFLKATGVAYALGGVIDAALYSTLSVAVGYTAKSYFKGERNPEKLKAIFDAKRKA